VNRSRQGEEKRLVCLAAPGASLGELTIDLLFQTITYRHGQLDTVQADFKAVSLSGQALSIMFFGTAVDPLERLNGEAVNEFGDTFVFSGQEEKDCEPEPFEEFRLQRDSTAYQRRGDY
jgi:hypothetical protein